MISPVTRKPRNWLFWRRIDVSSVSALAWTDWLKLFRSVERSIRMMLAKNTNIITIAEAMITRKDRPNLRGIFMI